MYRSGFTILRVRGIPISVSASWLFIAAFLTWSLSSQVFPHRYGGLSSSTYLVMGVVSAALFFASLVAHELGHAFRALKEGVRIEGITLWLLGGVARFLGTFPSAAAELRIAMAGPIVSVFLVVVYAVLAVAAGALGVSPAVQGIFEYLAVINGLLVVFNLVPALPLDGGRILRSLLWKRRGDFAAATRRASTLGQGFGLLLGAAGIWFLTHHDVTTGLWLSLVGVFILNAARSEALYGAADAAPAPTRVRDLMAADPAVVAPETTIDDLILRAASEATPPAAYPVATHGQLVGLISLQRASSIPAPDRAARTVGDAMTPREEVAVLAPDTPIREALGAIEASAEPAVVTEGGRITGLVSLLDVARALQVQLSGEAGRVRSRRTRVSAGMVVFLAAAAGLGAFWHPPVYVLSPGPAPNVSHDITITGMPARVPTASYLLTTVRAEQHSAIGDILQMFRPHRQLVTTADIGSIAFQDDMFRESRVLAAAAAGQARGLRVTFSGSGVEVTGLVSESGLRSGDVITGVDGAPVRTEFDLQDAVAPKPAGTRFTMTVRRGGRDVQVAASSVPIHGENALGIVGLTRDFDVAGPFKITFVTRDIGGPSAGLAYALAIYDALGTEAAGGVSTVAATGTIDRNGVVGNVGGVELKAVGARQDGAKLFIVPADEVRDATGLVASVKGVASLSDAVSIVRG